MTNGSRESDSLIVSGKPSNKACDNKQAAEMAERRRLAKGNPSKRNRNGTQCPKLFLYSELERIRQAALKDREVQFTTLWHHVYDIYRLRRAYFSLKRTAKPGVDGQTWQDYGKELDNNLRVLSDRLKRGSYRARAVKRVYIPKADGR